MKLSALLGNLEIVSVSACKDFEVKGVTDNSKQVKPAFIFTAIRGENADGGKFIGEAIRRGARAIVTQLPIKKDVSSIMVKDARKALADLAAEFYGHPSRKIKCIGVTGTNGKTTITYLLQRIFKQVGKNCGIIGTIDYRFNNKVIPAPNTTPGPVYLEFLLSRMVKAKLNYCAMEVSSHALTQERVRGIDFRGAIFTNLTSDHLDYHKNRPYYFTAKAKLFKMLDKDAYAVINIDDRYGRKLIKLTKAKVITYGIDGKADIRAKDLKLGWGKTSFKVSQGGPAYRSGRREFEIETKLIGRHNIYNILAALGAALAEKIPLADVIKAVYNLTNVAGRLERIGGRYPFNVFVDYAHTEDALKNVLSSLRDVAGRLENKHKIITVFGCGGDRDRTKRPKMGHVAAKLSDKIIVTSDNPRSEPPGAIINEILSGVSAKHRHKVEEVIDRYAAIRRALNMAARGDIVLIAGKGHEQYQIFKDKTIHFDDRETVRKILSSKYDV